MKFVELKLTNGANVLVNVKLIQSLEQVRAISINRDTPKETEMVMRSGKVFKIAMSYDDLTNFLKELLGD